MTTLRKILFFFFVGLYLVVAPLTVLYALGYIFNPVQQALLQTGLVSLASEPSHASVWLNGKLLQDKTPVILRNLKPEVYSVRLTFPGHHPWQKELKVEADRALRLENILLFPVDLEPEALGDFPLKKLWYISGAKSLLVLQGETASTLYLYHLEKNAFQPIFVQSRDQNIKVKDVLLHPLGDRAVVLLEREGNPDPYLVKFSDPLEVRNLADLFPEPFTELRWSPHSKDSLFYLKEGRLKRIELERRLFYPTLAKRVRGFAPFGRNLYVLDANRRFLKLTEKGRISEVLLDNPSQAKTIFGPDEGKSYSLFLFNRSLAVFLSESGRLSSNKLPYFLDEEVDQVVLAESRPRIFYRKGNELWVVDFNRNEEETFFESGPRPRRIYSGEESLSQIAPFYEDRYVLFSEGSRILVQDTEGDGEPLELLNISERVPEAALDSGEGFLYYAHPKTDRLTRVKLFQGGWLIPRIVDELMSPPKEAP